MIGPGSSRKIRGATIIPNRIQIRQPTRAPAMSIRRFKSNSPSVKRRGESRMTLVVPKSSSLVSRVSMAKLSMVINESIPISLKASIRCSIFFLAM